MRLAAVFLSLSLTSTGFADKMDVYYGTSGKISKGIYHSTFDASSGELGSPQLAAEIRSPGFLTTSPDGKILYAVGRTDEACVAAYRIGVNGELTLLNTAPIGDGSGVHLSVHPSNKFLITAQYGSGSVAVFSLHSDGSIDQRTQLIKHEGGSRVYEDRQDSPHPHWTGFSPDGRFAFVPDLGLDEAVIYKVDDRSGTFSPHGAAVSIPGGGARHMRFSTDANFIYLLNELSLSVTTFSYNAKEGTAKRLTTTSALTVAEKSRQDFNSASEILVHPNGKFVYSGNRGDDSVTLYWADSTTGELTVKDVENVRGAFPRHINLDPTGQWLLAAGEHSNTVTVFAIDQQSGELRHQTRNTINVPGCICILFRE